MTRTSLPKFNMDTSETDCCPRFDPEPWEDDEELQLQDWLFVRATTFNFLHVPLNMGSMMKRTWGKIQQEDAAPEDVYLVLSTDPSPWRGEHFFYVTKDVPGAEMVRLSGNFLVKVFEGPYHQAGKWVKEMSQHVESKGRELRKLYFFYTTCPKCAKHYGKNYVVGFAEV